VNAVTAEVVTVTEIATEIVMVIVIAIVTEEETEIEVEMEMMKTEQVSLSGISPQKCGMKILKSCTASMVTLETSICLLITSMERLRAMPSLNFILLRMPKPRWKAPTEKTTWTANSLSFLLEVAERHPTK